MSRSSPLASRRIPWVLAATVVAAALAFWRSSIDPFGWPKTAVLVFGVAIAAAVALRGVAVDGRLRLPWGLPAWAGMAFGAAVVVVFALEPSIFALVGASSRHTGALFHLTLVVAGLLVARAALDGDAARWSASRTIAGGVAAAGGLVGAVGVLQFVGVDLLGRAAGPVVTGTFGNRNFTAALVGASVPAAVWAVWDRAHPVVLRLLGAAAAVLALTTAVATRSVQGPVTAAVGLLVFVLAVLLGLQDPRVRRVALSSWALVTVAGAAVGGAGLVGRGPLGGLGNAANIDLRSYYWAAGTRMLADNPLTGVGFERYGAHFAGYRSEAAARRLDLSFAVDAAHNVPIHLFATGGVVVGVAYLAFVVLTAVAVVWALRRTAGRPRLLVGALAGVWAGYQAQSLVSIDTAPLGLLHWLSAGALLAWSGMVELRTFDLPWSRPRKNHEVRNRERLATAVLVPLLVLLAIGLLVPLRAGTAAATGRALRELDRPSEAIRELRSATAVAPWEPLYWNQLGDVALGARRIDVAKDAYAEALETEPRSVEALVTSARIAVEDGELERATELYDRALTVDPLAPTLLREVAAFLDEHGEVEEAARLRRRAEQVAGDDSG